MILIIILKYENQIPKGIQLPHTYLNLKKFFYENQKLKKKKLKQHYLTYLLNRHYVFWVHNLYYLYKEGHLNDSSLRKVKY